MPIGLFGAKKIYLQSLDVKNFMLVVKTTYTKLYMSRRIQQIEKRLSDFESLFRYTSSFANEMKIIFAFLKQVARHTLHDSSEGTCQRVECILHRKALIALLSPSPMWKGCKMCRRCVLV